MVTLSLVIACITLAVVLLAWWSTYMRAVRLESIVVRMLRAHNISDEAIHAIIDGSARLEVEEPQR